MSWQRRGQARSDFFILLAAPRSIPRSHTNTNAHLHTRKRALMHARANPGRESMRHNKPEVLFDALRWRGGCFVRRPREVRMGKRMRCVCVFVCLWEGFHLSIRWLFVLLCFMCLPSSSALSIFLLCAVPPFGRCTLSHHLCPSLPLSARGGGLISWWVFSGKVFMLWRTLQIITVPACKKLCIYSIEVEMNARPLLVCTERMSLMLHIAKKKSREHMAKIKWNARTGAFNGANLKKTQCCLYILCLFKAPIWSRSSWQACIIACNSLTQPERLKGLE